MKCRICGSNKISYKFKVKEKRINLLHEFNYVECKSCGCLQIEEYPDNIAQYYPEDYYSYNVKKKIENSEFKLLIKRIISNQTTGHNETILGRILNSVLKEGFVRYLKDSKLKLNDPILDVGTGTGFNLISLYNYGFTNLHGIDPFALKEWSFRNNIKIEKKSIFDLDGNYKFVMLNHSLEHMPEQHKVMAKLAELVDENDGTLLIRIPLSTGYAIRAYKENCVSIDAPRHFYLHSVNSITNLAKEYGFVLERLKYDSTDFQFWGSIQYENNIFLTSPNSYYISPSNSIFDKKQIVFFRKKAEELNNLNDGNICAFYFKKINNK